MMSNQTIRIAVLECDITIGRLAEGYGPIFRRLLTVAAAKLRKDDRVALTLDVTWFNVVEHPEKYPKLDDVDAVLLSGSSTYNGISLSRISLLGLFMLHVQFEFHEANHHLRTLEPTICQVMPDSIVNRRRRSAG
jgi:hypothetical protein